MSSDQNSDQVSRSPRLKAAAASRTTSTFSCDIAHAVSRGGKRPAKPGPWLRSPVNRPARTRYRTGPASCGPRPWGEGILGGRGLARRFGLAKPADREGAQQGDQANRDREGGEEVGRLPGEQLTARLHDVGGG